MKLNKIKVLYLFSGITFSHFNFEIYDLQQKFNVMVINVYNRGSFSDSVSFSGTSNSEFWDIWTKSLIKFLVNMEFYLIFMLQ